MMDRKHSFVPFAAAMVAFTLGAPAAGRAADVSSPAYGSLHWRYVGPARGGRTQAATGVPNDPFSY
ncbi:MAG: hypothetical protein JO192_12250, partial [Candidatus Eremiobacteraeota bacterium]|nr:hypothetical protein [Candidatus Eremiobacteraeota bacterium]